MTNTVLPQAKENYDRETFQRLLDYVRELEQEVFKQNANVEIHGEEDSGGRRPDLILHSPDGTRYAVRAKNAPTSNGFTFTAL